MAKVDSCDTLNCQTFNTPPGLPVGGNLVWFKPVLAAHGVNPPAHWFVWCGACRPLKRQNGKQVKQVVFGLKVKFSRRKLHTFGWQVFLDESSCPLWRDRV
jgi:hypothetical protein